MADKLISQLGATAAVLTTDLLVKEPNAGPPAEKATVAQLITLLDSIYVNTSGDTMTGLLTIAQATSNTSALISTGYSLTGANAQSLMDLAGTWNTTGVPTALKLNITNTASDAASLLIALQTSSVNRLSLKATGQAFIFGGLTVHGTAAWAGSEAGNGQIFLGDGSNEVKAYILQNGGGQVGFSSTGFIAWGSGSNALGAQDVGIKRSAAGLMEVNDSSGGTFRDLELRNIITNNAAAAFSTNTTLTDFAGAGAGTLTNAPTAGNPTKWCGFDDNGTTRYFPTWV